MYIQKRDMYQLHNDSYLPYDKLLNNRFPFFRMFFLYSFGYLKRMGIIKFIKELETIYKHGMLFELVFINIDTENNLVYFSEAYDDFCDKPTTPEIEALLEEENFIKLCQIGFLAHAIMTKENFIHLLLAWDAILDKLPPCILLYLDDNDWYDVLPFDSQEAMEKFIADYTKVEILEQ